MGTSQIFALVIVLFIIGIFQFILLQKKLKRARELRNLLRRQEAQSHFAIARNKLLMLSMEDKIDVNSIAFKELYRFNTTFMRRPDNYQVLSEYMANSLFSNEEGKGGKRSLEEEMKINPEIKDVLLLSADAIGYLVVEYSRILRLLNKILMRIDRNHSHIHLVDTISQRVRKKREMNKKSKSLQSQLYNIAGTYKKVGMTNPTV